MTSPDVINS